MDNKLDKIRTGNENLISPVESTDQLDDSLDLSNKVSEIAGENISENQSSKAQASKGDAKKKEDETPLRERLLEKAPKAQVMRAQIERELIKEKQMLESEFKKVRNSKKYHLIAQVLSDLRAVIRQISELAELSLEALRELWLKVVMKFS